MRSGARGPSTQSLRPCCPCHVARQSQVGAVPKLVALLGSPSVEVASAATTALMTITISREGKYALVEGGAAGVGALARLLNPRNEQLCIKAMEVVTNVCEAPEARPLMHEGGVVEALGAIHQLPGASDMLRHSAAQAIRQCGFKHLPYEVLPGRKIVVDATTGQASSVPVDA